ncbi:MAG: VWA domain-containing protein [Nitrospinota bacterium]
MSSVRESETPRQAGQAGQAGQNPPSPTESSRRIRWERLAQITSRNFRLKLSYGPGHGSGGSQVSIQPGGSALAERGETLHEAAHLLAGSLRGRDRARRLSAGTPPAEALALEVIWHALEDARAERQYLDRYPGAEPFLYTRWENDFRRDSEAGKLHPLVRLAWGIYRTGRGKGALELDPGTRFALGAIGPWVKRGASCANPEEVADTALEIFRHCRPYIDLSEEELSRRMEETPTSGLEGELSSESEDEAEGKPEAEETEKVPLLRLEPEDLVSQCFGGSPWLDREAPPKEVHPDALAPDGRTCVIPPEGRMEEYLEIFSQSGNEVLVMIRRLQRMIRERQDVRYAGAYRSGKLNLAKVWKQRTGNYRLFQRRVEPDRLDVAFSLLVDESGSMNRKQKYVVARQAAVLCAEALDGISVPFEVIGYSTEASEAVMAHNCGHVPVFQYRHVRHSRLQHRLYKTFDEAYRSVRTRLVHVAPRFNNWDEEHLAFAARRLAGRPEGVRAIIIISDGQPNGNVHNLMDAVAELERRGFRIVAVGIEDEYVREIYPNHVVVREISQLAAELIALLERELLGRRAPSA